MPSTRAVARMFRTAVRCRALPVARLSSTTPVPAARGAPSKPCVGRARPLSSAAAADAILCPKERPGVNYTLNWSLAADDVTSAGNAYHNPSAELLVQKLGVDAAGNTVALAAPKSTGEREIIETGGEAMDFEMFDEVREHLVRHLSSGVDLFVTDGAVGASSECSVGVRVVTDSAACALAVRNILVRVPGQAPASQPVTVYWVAGTTDVAEGLAAVQYEEGGDGALAGATALLAGMHTQPTLRSAIFKAASALLLEKAGVVPVPAAVLRGATGKTGLFVGLSAEAAATALAEEVLAAAHHSVWAPSGLSPFWGGAAAGGTGRCGVGEIALLVDGVVTAPLQGDATLAAPSAIFVDGASGALDVAKVSGALSTAEAEEDVVERLMAAMQSNGTPAYGVRGVAQALAYLNK